MGQKNRAGFAHVLDLRNKLGKSQSPVGVTGPRHIFATAVIFVLYFILAKLGLMLGPISGFAALVWPPTGLALTSLIVFGFRVWPAIALGALLANWSQGAPFAVSMGISAGNTLEAVLAAYLLGRIGFQRSLERVRDVFGLVFFGALLSTLVSTTLGSLSLYLGAVIGRDAFGATWLAWWFGDMMGDLIFAPFLLVWSTGVIFRSVRWLWWLESIFMGILVIVSNIFIFTDVFGLEAGPFLRGYLIFPVLMLVALRRDQRWSVSALLVTATVVTTTTISGHGRFWVGSLIISLLEVQEFLTVVFISTMVLAAAITERKKETALRAAIAVVNARLYKEAQEAVFARDDLLSIASHEIRTPLTAISLRLQIFNREVKKSPITQAEGAFVSHKAVALVASCEEQVRNLSALLDNLLDLANINAGKLLLKREPVDLCGVVNDVVSRFQIQAADMGVKIKVHCEPAAAGFWDKIRMEQVVSNLISNALKYGRRSPVSVSVSQDDLHGTARLSVKDEGMGVSPEMRDRIFERLERGGADLPGISGLGLGLYICRRIVEAHGGIIKVESELGKGTAFIIELPNREVMAA